MAASSRVGGMVLINPFSMIMENGSMQSRWVNAIPKWVSMICSRSMARYSGTSVDAWGIILHSRMHTITRFFPR